MGIRHIIVHHLAKDRRKKSELVPRDTELTISPAAVHLLESIDTVFERSGRAYGVFKEDGQQDPFRGQLERYLDDPKIDFTKFTRRAMAHFKKAIDGEPLATGGYVAFILLDDEANDGEEEETSPQHLMIAMLNDHLGTAVIPETLDIQDVTHLVLNELHLAADIDIAGWHADRKNYVSFVTGRAGRTVAQYFLDFIGCDAHVDSDAESRLLVHVVNSYISEFDLTKKEARLLRKEVYDAAAEANRHEVNLNLTDVSSRINPSEPKQFLRHANSMMLTSDFAPDLRVLRHLGRYAARGGGLTISFDATLFGNSVQYDRNTKKLIIKNVPPSLLQQLGL